MIIQETIQLTFWVTANFNVLRKSQTKILSYSYVILRFQETLKLKFWVIVNLTNFKNFLSM